MCSKENSNVLRHLEEELNSVHETWQKELVNHTEPTVAIPVTKNVSEVTLEEAKVLFLNGRELECNGQWWEAIRFYMHAFHLIPNINKYLEAETKKDMEDVTVTDQGTSILSINNCNADTVKEDNLLNCIQQAFKKNDPICMPSEEQKTIHISELPKELFIKILSWLLLTDLDMGSLERCSRTCRGFYLCCRNPEIWKLACSRSLGVNFLSIPKPYLSWRNFFIEQAVLRFNGCYLSKTGYIRYGENKFQNEWYSPCYMITYYRYLRFFSDGLVLMLTTPDPPELCVSELCRNFKNPAILSGYYGRVGNKLMVVVFQQNSDFKMMDERIDQHICGKRCHIKMQIQNHKRRKNVVLAWIDYSVYLTNKDNTHSKTVLDLNENTFPPMWFYPVKSYTQEYLLTIQ